MAGLQASFYSFYDNAMSFLLYYFVLILCLIF